MAVGIDPKVPFWDGIVDKALHFLARHGLALGRYKVRPTTREAT